MALCSVNNEAYSSDNGIAVFLSYEAIEIHIGTNTIHILNVFELVVNDLFIENKQHHEKHLRRHLSSRHVFPCNFSIMGERFYTTMKLAYHCLLL